VDGICFEGQEFQFGDQGATRKFRMAVKAAIMSLPAGEAAALVEQVSRTLCAQGLKLPDFAMSVSIEELRELRDIGVRIENHGWSHIDIKALDREMLWEHICRASAWLANHLSVVSSPNGSTSNRPAISLAP
jgi:peptidoglycan/xylan/chitin deacetylase (PgdA/CDA1 family)